MSQKITLISFDHWGYDIHIVDALKKNGIDANHIKIGGFKHKNIFAQLRNTFSKIFLDKNPKKILRQEYILEKLNNLGKQNQILVINPDVIDLKYHLEIKKYTKKYIAYLYDSIERCPVKHLLEGVFDDIYSFDKNDIEKYKLLPITNYIYFEKEKITTEIKQKFIYIGSIDNRLKILNIFGENLKLNNQSFAFYAIGKKAFVNQLEQFFLGKNKNIIFKRKRFTQEQTLNKYRQSHIIIDLIRENQVGISFRIFEAMGLNKKVITNNKNVENYGFYNSGNILIMNEDFKISDNLFLESNYNALENGVYEKYTVDTWVKCVFGLKNN